MKLKVYKCNLKMISNDCTEEDMYFVNLCEAVIVRFVRVDDCDLKIKQQ